MVTENMASLENQSCGRLTRAAPSAQNGFGAAFRSPWHIFQGSGSRAYLQYGNWTAVAEVFREAFANEAADETRGAGKNSIGRRTKPARVLAEHRARLQSLFA